MSANRGKRFGIGHWPPGLSFAARTDAMTTRGFSLHVQGGHAEPLDEFPKMEAFLDTHFRRACR